MMGLKDLRAGELWFGRYSHGAGVRVSGLVGCISKGLVRMKGVGRMGGRSGASYMGRVLRSGVGVGLRSGGGTGMWFRFVFNISVSKCRRARLARSLGDVG